MPLPSFSRVELSENSRNRRYRPIVKRSQGEFRAAMAPVLTDLERDYPSLLRVEESPNDPDWHAHLQDSAGGGTGICLSDSLSGEEAVVAAAGEVQEAAFEALWREGKSTTWPSCPLHPGTHPLKPGVVLAVASWRCPKTGEVVARIGS